MKSILALVLVLNGAAAHADFFTDKLDCMNAALATGSRAKAVTACASTAAEASPDKKKKCAAGVAKKLDGAYYWTVKMDEDVAQSAADNACAQSYDVEKAVACLEDLYGRNGVSYSMRDAGMACARGNSAARAKDCIEGLIGTAYADGQSVDKHQAAMACAGGNGYGVLKTCFAKFGAMTLKANHSRLVLDEVAQLCSRLPVPEVTQSADASADTAR